MVLCTIGFFVLIGLMFKGKMPFKGDGANYAAAPSAAVPSAAAPSADGAPEAVGEVKPIGTGDWVRGDKNAPVTLFVWSDYECPFCSRFHPTMLQAMNEYKGKIKWVARHFPLSFHPQAVPAANAAECAGEQGKFWEFSDALYAGQSSLGDAFYGTTADSLKLNRTKFDSCYTAKKYGAKITQQQTDGSAAGVSGTPGTIIVAKDGSKQMVPGAVPYEQLKGMIETALAK